VWIARSGGTWGGAWTSNKPTVEGNLYLETFGVTEYSPFRLTLMELVLLPRSATMGPASPRCSSMQKTVVRMDT